MTSSIFSKKVMAGGCTRLSAYDRLGVIAELRRVSNYPPESFMSESDEPDLQFHPTDAGYRLEIQMPGVRPDQVSASVGTTMVVTITGTDESKFQVFEIPVLDDLDPDTIEAEMAHGLFVATATRRNRMRQIPVKTPA